MNLELPPDASVLLVISPARGVGYPDAGPLPAAYPPPRSRRLLLKGTALAVLMGSAYFLGGHSVQQAGALPARALTYAPRPPARDLAHMTPEDDVPPAFAQQLQRTPTVTPPPGATPPGTPAKNGFGLED